MNHKIKRKWCAALRGRNWEQCFGKLHEGHKRCAIGVLGEVLGLDVSSKPSLGPAIPETTDQIASASGLTDNQVKQVVGRNDGAVLLENRKYGYFCRATFPELADWIEENIPETQPLPVTEEDDGVALIEASVLPGIV